MLRKNPSGDYPTVSEKAFIDPTAIICGHVIIEDNVFVGPYAVIRADEVDESGSMQPIVIQQDSNIQDGVVIHSKGGAAVSIGARTSIAHRSIVHGPCTIGNDVFIGLSQTISPHYDQQIIRTVQNHFDRFYSLKLSNFGVEEADFDYLRQARFHEIS